MGKAAFLDVRDQGGRIQLHFRRDALPDFADLDLVDLGDFLEVSGTLFRTRTGEVTVSVVAWRVITKAVRPMPDAYHGLTDVETRYRQRYLDLIANERSRGWPCAVAPVQAVTRPSGAIFTRADSSPRPQGST